jgi:hypothetical protein
MGMYVNRPWTKFDVRLLHLVNTLCEPKNFMYYVHTYVSQVKVLTTTEKMQLFDQNM